MKPWVRNMLVWICIGLFLVLTLSFSSIREHKVLCSEVRIDIIDSLENQFISQKEIEQFIYTLEDEAMGRPVGEINTLSIEEELMKNPVLEKVEAYVDVEGVLHIQVDQRNPIVRIINKKGESYYLDKSGHIIPVQAGYTPLLLVASGNIVEDFEWHRATSIFTERNEKGRNKTLHKVFEMANMINKKPFWTRQIEQIYVNEKGEFELIPRVGAHLILLGAATDFENQLRQLWAFYQQGLHKVGWNRYEIINLKFENQIVCTKR